MAADADLAWRIERLGQMINSRRWGWATRAYATETADMYGDRAVAQVYAFMVYILAGKYAKALQYRRRAFDCPDITGQQKSGIERDLAAHHIDACHWAFAESAIRQAESHLAPTDDHNLFIVLDVLRARVLQGRGDLAGAAELFERADAAYAKLEQDKVNGQFYFNLRVRRLHIAALRGDRQQVHKLLQLIKADTERYSAWRIKIRVACIGRPLIARFVVWVLNQRAIWRFHRL